MRQKSKNLMEAFLTYIKIGMRSFRILLISEKNDNFMGNSVYEQFCKVENNCCSSSYVYLNIYELGMGLGSAVSLLGDS